VRSRERNVWRWTLAAAALTGIWGAAGCGQRPGKEDGKNPALPAASGAAAAGRFNVIGPGDKPLAAGVAFYDAGRHDRPRWEGMAGDDYRVPVGRYDILVEYYGQKYWLRGEDVAGGPLEVRLPMGTLVVNARTSRGDPLRGEVAVYPSAAPGDKPAVMTAETGEDIPLLEGTYEAVVRVQGRERRIPEVVVDAGGRAAEAITEPVGYLVATVTRRDGRPVPAEVWVYGEDTPHTAVAIGVSGRPITLLPGRYDVAVKAEGFEDYSADVGVLLNVTTNERFTVPEKGEP